MSSDEDTATAATFLFSRRSLMEFRNVIMNITEQNCKDYICLELNGNVLKIFGSVPDSRRKILFTLQSLQDMNDESYSCHISYSLKTLHDSFGDPSFLESLGLG